MATTLKVKKPLVRSTLAESVYEVVLEAIIAGRLAPGAELSIVALSKDLDVSRTPVNEALRHLAQDGLIEQATNRKAKVCVFTSEDVREIFEMRSLLEGESVFRAATRMEPAAIKRLRDSANHLSGYQDTAHWLTRWIDHDEDFHRAIAKASGNARLAHDIGRYRLLHRGFNRLISDTRILPTALAEHLKIIDAIEARDAKAARTEMLNHIARSQKFFIENFPGQ